MKIQVLLQFYQFIRLLWRSHFDLEVIHMLEAMLCIKGLPIIGRFDKTFEAHFVGLLGAPLHEEIAYTAAAVGRLYKADFED